MGGLRLGLLGCLGLMLGLGLSCIGVDTEYCENRSQCGWADTPMGPMQLFCHQTRHVCLLTGEGICTKDEECPVDHPHCDVDKNACTTCRVNDASDTSCSRFPDRPLCGNATDGSGGTLCLACRNNRDCPGVTPICDNQQCRKCSTHSDCEGELNCDDGVRCTDSLVCIGAGETEQDLAGRCAQNGSTASGRVVYVNGSDPACASSTTDPRPGSQLATPQCDLPNALLAARTHARRYIRVIGAYTETTLDPLADGAAYTFIGAPVPSKGYPMATVSGRGTIFALKSSGLSSGSLTLDQLDILERSAMIAVSCAGSSNSTDLVPRLTLRRNIIRGGTMPGTTGLAAVSVNNCNTVMDGNVIGLTQLTDLGTATAHGKGIQISDVRFEGTTSYLIQNNLIAGNLGVGIDLQSTANGTRNIVLRFNTIVGNGRDTPTRSGAVFCGLTAQGQEFSHSIVFNNSLSTAEHSQFSNAADCGFKDLVVGSAEGLLNNPAFSYQNPVLDAQLRLVAGGNDCCIDKVAPGAGEVLPSQDIDGTARPQGAKWDVGAGEVKQ